MFKFIFTVLLMVSLTNLPSLSFAESKKIISKKNGKTYTITYFEKPIDLFLFKKYSKMTFEELILEAQKNLTFFRFKPDSKKETQKEAIIKTFKEAPRYLEPAFKRLKNGKVEYMAGVFVNKERVNMKTGTDVILLSEYANFHVLLHEMTHYLYNEARETLDIQAQVAAGKFQDDDPFFAEFRKFDRNNNTFLNIDHESDTIDNLIIFSEIKYQNLHNYALEEVSVSKLELLVIKDPENAKRLSKEDSIRYAKDTLGYSLNESEFILDKIKIILANTTAKGKMRNAKKLEKLRKLELKFVELVALIKDNIQILDAFK